MNRLVITACCMQLMAGCSSDNKKATTSTKLRAAEGGSNLILGPNTGLFLNTMLANSTVNMESFKVPIHRVNLVAGFSGTAYSEASPAFYTCPGTTDAECYVDLAESENIDNLLKSSGPGEVKMDRPKVYNGAAVEFCSDSTAGNNNRTFEMLLKGSVVLGEETYYTNAVSGLSLSAPAEEVKVSAPCGGQTTYTAEPVTLGPDNPVSLVVYVEPAGALLATNFKTLVNSNCAGGESLAICASRPSIFVAVSETKPKVERYLLNVQGSKDGKPWADMLLTTLFDGSNDQPIGATVQQIYRNTIENRLMHSLQFTLELKKDGEAYDVSYGGTSGSVWLDNLKREDGGEYTISTLVDTTVKVNPDKLD